jgi:hypothetical protein
MKNWRTSAGALLLIVCAGLWTAPANAEPAAVDSLVWYVEQLEHDLAVCQIRGDARADSLAIRCEVLGWRLDDLQKNQRRWWHDQRLWFIAGAALGVWVAGQAVRVSF